ncbi:hypothetical protein DOE63_32490 (plasmid) [Salmonella enterica subsp. diarizonae serovar 59:z10:-]|nr:hypothetical protein DOE63_32490 [Salmonella enterica subsp. diarizonae serovar 59:z10:-]
MKLSITAPVRSACQCIGISIRTLQRWIDGGVISADRRLGATDRVPKINYRKQKGSKFWQYATLEFASLPPNVIVPMLADKGVYIASESTLSRIKISQSTDEEIRECQYKRPDVLKAVAPNRSGVGISVIYRPGSEDSTFISI